MLLAGLFLGLGAVQAAERWFLPVAELEAGSPAESGKPPVVQTQWEAAYYLNCDAARAAGAAPMLSGRSGYRPELDGDGDGIACEPYRGR